MSNFNVNYKELERRFKKKYRKSREDSGLDFNEKGWKLFWRNIVLEGIDKNLTPQERREKYNTTELMLEYLVKELIP